jgi:hydroxymethylglutaryl-CoA lyase
MSNLPARVLIHEEAPREGFQSEPTFIPTETKIAFIEALANTGVREINCVSFVNPKRVPQMADSELVAAGLRRREGVRYTGTWMNLQGFERALKSGVDLPGVLFLAASEQFGLENNHQDRTAMLREQQQLRERYREIGLPVSGVYVFTAFGCNYQGDIAPAIVERAVADLLDVVGADASPVVYLADTVGWASPWSIERTVGMLRERWPQLAIGLHLHDTRGLGLANAAAGLRLGVTHFDASCGGLGGCPFAGNPAAAGNIATEELLLLCEEAGIATGVDLEAMIDCVALAESIVGHPLPSKVAKSGSLQSRRRGTVTTM